MVLKLVWLCNHGCVHIGARHRAVAALECERSCVCLVIAVGVYVPGYAGNRVVVTSSASAVSRARRRCVLVSSACCKDLRALW